MKGLQETLRAQAGWNPQRVISAYFPAMADLCRAVQPEVQAIQASLDRDEARGLDTACLRQALRELRWRLEYTADARSSRELDRIRTPAAGARRAQARTRKEGGVGTEVPGF
jgi:hypothetical protein